MSRRPCRLIRTRCSTSLGLTSGTAGIPAASGSYYAQAGTNPTQALDQFTRLDGYSSTFPAGGFGTSVDIYLDMNGRDGRNDLRFDWSSAVTNQAGAHLRDFIFSVGTSTTAGQFVMSASNNSPGWPANPGRDPFTVSTTGWYTFQNQFSDNGGVLSDEIDRQRFLGRSAHVDVERSERRHRHDGWRQQVRLAGVQPASVTRSRQHLEDEWDCHAGRLPGGGHRDQPGRLHPVG